MPQIHLFTGENSFALRSEILRWMQEFRTRHGDENLLRLDARSLPLRDLLDEIASAPFIAERRLIVIDGIPNYSKEDIAMIKQEIHPQSVLLFYSEKPDKRLTSTKELLKICEIKQFPILPLHAVRKWVGEYIISLGGNASAKAQDKLLNLVGEDQAMLASEIQKLVLFVGGKEIQAEDIEEMVVCCSERIAWHMIDLLGQGKSDEALVYAESLIDRGESPYALWNRLLWMVDQLALVGSAVAEGETHPGMISKNFGIGFGSVRTLLPLARRLSQDQINSLVEEVVSADIALKTGGYRSTAEAPQEIRALIDRCILRFA